MRVIPAALLLLAVLASPADARAQANVKSGTDLTGTWIITATIPHGTPVCPGTVDCVYPALTTATGDGALLQTAPISNTLTGHGSWTRVGPRDFKAKTLYFRVDPATGAFVGTSVTQIQVSVAPGGQDATGTFSAVIRDAANQVITSYSGTMVARRVVAD